MRWPWQHRITAEPRPPDSPPPTAPSSPADAVLTRADAIVDRLEAVYARLEQKITSDEGGPRGGN